MVRAAHDFAELPGRAVGQADVVPAGLRHVVGAVGADKDGERKSDTGWLPGCLLEFGAGHDIKQLLCRSKLHVGAQMHGVVALQQGVEKLVKPDRVTALHAATR